MARIYVASSWRNPYQQAIVQSLRNHDHAVYDFRNPEHGRGGFSWSEIDDNWQNWTAVEYLHHLQNSPEAAQGFMADQRAMQWCDTCVLVMPCGRSAHLELGWCAGRGKRTIILLDERQEPELMNLLADEIVTSIHELVDLLHDFPSQRVAGNHRYSAQPTRETINSDSLITKIETD